MKLADWPLNYLRIACAQCGREGKLSVAKLEDEHGLDVDMAVLLHAIREPTCARTNKAEVCQAILADAILIDTVFEPDVSKVLDRSLLPEAREIRERLGLDITEFDSSKDQAA